MTLALEGVAKRIEETQALAEVDLEVGPGEIVALLGANGAGKTTSIRVLLGLLRPDRGRVLLEGETADSVALREGVAYVHADLGVYPRLTAREHLLFTARAAGRRGPEVKERVAEVLERLGLGSQADRRLETLSSGNRQRVLLGRALVRPVRYVVLDEPTANLDLATTQEMLVLLEEEKARGRGVLLSTHQVWIAERIADRVVVLDSGRSVATWARDEVPEGGLAHAFLEVTGI